MVKPSDSQSQSGGQASSSAVSIYASSSDPVHVPSPDSRSSVAIGAVRRDVGVVGGRQHSSDSTSKQLFKQNISNSKSVSGSSSNTESFQAINTGSANDKSHSTVMGSVMISSAGTRLVNQFSGRSHQQPVGHHRGMLLFCFYYSSVIPQKITWLRKTQLLEAGRVMCELLRMECKCNSLLATYPLIVVFYPSFQHDFLSGFPDDPFL